MSETNAGQGPVVYWLNVIERSDGYVHTLTAWESQVRAKSSAGAASMHGSLAEIKTIPKLEPQS